MWERDEQDSWEDHNLSLPTVCQPQPDAITKFDNPEPTFCPSLDTFGGMAGGSVRIRVFLHCLPTVESIHNLLGWFLF